MNAKGLKELADNVFGKRSSLLSLWQEQAENFYPERADFTVKRYLGEEFAGNLSTSYPILARRDFGDQVGQMLRPTQKQWFHMGLLDTRRENNEAKRWLEWSSGTMFRAMYDPHALFDRAEKEGDHDFSCFGQDVISVRLNRNRDGLLYRCWHLRDVAWVEDDEGKVCPIFRKWNPTAQTLVRLAKLAGTFKIDPKIEEMNRKTPFEEVECMHMIVQADMYDDETRFPYWSIYYDCMHDTLIEAVPTWNKEYSVERWQTVSGSQYAYSPATVAALPDARLLQAITYTLLEAGEKAANPPMVATQEAVRSDIDIRAGGTTWVDYEYDERLGDALRPITIDTKGLPIGLEMAQDLRRMLGQAFYLNKLRPFLPTEDKEMTAFQAGQIVAQYIRDALPLFAPMETNRNAQICELTFDVLMRAGTFGSPQDMPPSLDNADTQFRFSSPLHDLIEAQKAQKFLEAHALVAQGMAMDKTSVALIDWKGALRDALDGKQTPAKWIRSEIQVREMEDAQRQQEETAALLANMQAGANVAETVGKAAGEMVPA